MKPLATALLAVIFFAFAVDPAQAQLDPQDLVLEAPDGSRVSIDRDTWGVPHIRASTEAALFHGQGYAAAQDRLFQMETFRRAALGRLSEVGLGTVESDRQTRTVFYTEAERQAQFNALPANVQTLYTSFVDGINRYLDSLAADPQTYKPLEFDIRSFEPEPWTVSQSVAVTQFLIRRFGGFGGEELARCAELRANGLDWLNENRPINDPAAPTTILDGSASTPPFPQTGLDQCPAAGAQAMPAEQEIRIEMPGGAIVIPKTLGSFATLITPRKAAGGQVLLLGAPQLQDELRRNSALEQNTSIASEVELEAPGLHVGGLQLAGIPGVILGRTERHAWTLTSGRTDNQDLFLETTETDAPLDENRYLFDGDFQDFEAIEEPDLDFTHYRTVHGPVVGDSVEAGEAYALAYAYWMEELDMVTAFYNIWKAESRADFEAVAADVPVSFNLFYADREQDVSYWHVGKYPDRAATGVDPRLPHLGDGSQEWAGFVDFADQPQATGADQPFFVNWNNKPSPGWDQGDNVPWIGDQRVDSLYMYVPAGTAPFSYDDLTRVPDAIDDFGTYQQAIRFGETLADDRDENTVPPGQSGFLGFGFQTSAHYNDQWDQLRVERDDFLGEEPEDFRFKDMIFVRGVHTFAGSDLDNFDYEAFGVAVDPSALSGPLTVAAARATDASQGAPEEETLPDGRVLAVEGSWTLVPGDAAATLTADVCFDLDRLTAEREDVAFGELEVYRRADAGSPWAMQNVALRPDADDPQQICALAAEGLGEFAVAAEPSALPVELAALEAARDGEAVVLAWQTATETNNAGFAIERRVRRGAQQTAWTEIGFEDGAGTTTQPQRYRFVDESVPYAADEVTYRLRQIDADGTVTLSRAVPLALQPEAFALDGNFPNPVRAATTIRYALPEAAAVRLAVYDVLGRPVAVLVDEEQPAGRKELRFRADRLPSGVYFYRLDAGTFSETRRMVIVR